MSIYLWSSKISKVYIWGNEASAVYKWTTKIRPDLVPVTWVTLNTNSITFTTKNATQQLTATVSPATATNKNVTWSSSDTNVATVSSTWLVTCKWAWTCTITVTTQDWWYTATCWIVCDVLKTITISWTEKSDMSSGRTYSDDAAWLTAGSTAFDTFFGYSAVKLSSSWVETASVTQAQSGWPWKLNISSLWTITSGDNVMIKFPVRWIKMTKSWTLVTLSITKTLNRESEWYQYYAHCTWSISSPWSPKSAFYVWAYMGCMDTNNQKLFSLSWLRPDGNATASTFCTYAKNNGSWYNIIWFYQRQYINALYIMKYWNPDSQSVIWRWYVPWSRVYSTWTTNRQTNATYWSSSASTHCKLFWLEDRWGARHQILWGCYLRNGRLYTALNWWNWNINQEENTGIFVQSSYDAYSLSSVSWTNTGMFVSTGIDQNVNCNTYYCDEAYANTSGYIFCMVGGDYGDYYSNRAGVFCIMFAYQYSEYHSNSTSSRLMYLDWLT